MRYFILWILLSILIRSHRIRRLFGNLTDEMNLTDYLFWVLKLIKTFQDFYLLFHNQLIKGDQIFESSWNGNVWTQSTVLCHIFLKLSNFLLDKKAQVWFYSMLILCVIFSYKLNTHGKKREHELKCVRNLGYDAKKSISSLSIFRSIISYFYINIRLF